LFLFKILIFVKFFSYYGDQRRQKKRQPAKKNQSRQRIVDKRVQGGGPGLGLARTSILTKSQIDEKKQFKLHEK